MATHDTDPQEGVLHLVRLRLHHQPCRAGGQGPAQTRPSGGRPPPLSQASPGSGAQVRGCWQCRCLCALRRWPRKLTLVCQGQHSPRLKSRGATGRTMARRALRMGPAAPRRLEGLSALGLKSPTTGNNYFQPSPTHTAAPAQKVHAHNHQTRTAIFSPPLPRPPPHTQSELPTRLCCVADWKESPAEQRTVTPAWPLCWTF